MAAPTLASRVSIYSNLWATATVKPNWQPLANNFVNKAIQNKNRYVAIAAKTGVPWYVIAAIHMRESTMNFNGHLHNGDPLTARTRQVPAGRPKLGNPPFTFEYSAIDAINGRPKHNDWSVEGCLYYLEGYNGWGYKNKVSPYVWSGTNHYTSGKYVADGVYSSTAVDKQLGTATFLKEILRREGITLQKKKSSLLNRLGNNSSIGFFIDFFLLLNKFKK